MDSLIAKIETKLDKSGDCWLWTAYTSRDGQPYVWVNGRFQRAHRIYYKHCTGKDLGRTFLARLCGDSRCLRPEHVAPFGSPAHFWSKVDMSEAHGCWVWTSTKNELGYGMYRFDGRARLAHRHAWLITHGEPAGKLLVCHTCDNPPCVNPDHLWLGTDMDNMRDCVRKGRHNKPRGLQNAKTKITPALAEQVRSLRSKSILSQLAIAKHFGISQQSVSQIILGKDWTSTTIQSGY